MSVENTIRNIRTLEDIQYVLNILYTNLNNLDRVYYDMFINPTPMDIELERYDENGNLTTVVLPNRAKDKLFTYTGQGNPNGQQVARYGALYLDLSNGNMYFKATESGSSGWILIWSENNLNYLAPDGDGSQLTNLNATQITLGVLSVLNGGTGNGGNLTGLIKGNGSNPYSIATPDIDYLTQNTFIGMICYFPKVESQSQKRGWLRCNGGTFASVDYPLLSAYLGSNTLPNLDGKFIRCLGTGSGNILITQEQNIGKHKHSYSGNITSSGAHGHSISSSGAHTHTTESSSFTNYGMGPLPGGGAIPALIQTEGSWGAHTHNISSSGAHTHSISSSGAHTHSYSGDTDNNSDETENRPTNVALVAMIRCDIKLT